MGYKQIDCVRTTPADVQAVWRLLGDSATWPSWTRIEAHTAVRPARPDGTGEVRVFKTGRYEVREEIVERRPLERLSSRGWASTRSACQPTSRSERPARP